MMNSTACESCTSPCSCHFLPHDLLLCTDAASGKIWPTSILFCLDIFSKNTTAFTFQWLVRCRYHPLFTHISLYYCIIVAYIMTNPCSSLASALSKSTDLGVIHLFMETQMFLSITFKMSRVTLHFVFQDVPMLMTGRRDLTYCLLYL